MKDRAASAPHGSDAIVAIEVFELLPDPATALGNMAAMLRPQGSLFMQFPNYENPRWPTFYRSREGLEANCALPDSRNGKSIVFVCRPGRSACFTGCTRLPCGCYRAHPGAQRQEPAQRLEDYDGTWAFHHGSSLEAIKVPIHLYWAAIMILMRLGGDVFRRVECGDEIFGKNLFVAASTGGNGRWNRMMSRSSTTKQRR